MESRRIVLMNLPAGKEWRCRHREQTYGKKRGTEREGQIEKAARVCVCVCVYSIKCKIASYGEAAL